MTLLTLLSIVLSTFFIFASSIKIFAWQKQIFAIQLAFFEKYGLNRTMMMLVGCIELSGAIAIWLPSYLGILGSFALAATSAGAIVCHLYFDTIKDGIPAMITLILSSILLYSQYLVL